MGETSHRRACGLELYLRSGLEMSLHLGPREVTQDVSEDRKVLPGTLMLGVG